MQPRRAQFATCASPKTYTGLARGKHSFRVRAVDGAGNTDPTPAAREWQVDAKAPATKLTEARMRSPRATPASSSPRARSTRPSSASSTAATTRACSSPKTYPGTGRRRTGSACGRSTRREPRPVPGEPQVGGRYVAARDGHRQRPAARLAQGQRHLHGLERGRRDLPVPPRRTRLGRVRPGVGALRREACHARACEGPRRKRRSHARELVVADRPAAGDGDHARDRAARLRRPRPPSASPPRHGGHVPVQARRPRLVVVHLRARRTRASPGLAYVQGARQGLRRDERPFAGAEDVDGRHVAPNTTITSGPKASTGSKSATFSFSSSESRSTFECRLDGGAWQACSSPRTYSGLKKGAHVFRVRAIDAAGNTDATPDM